MRAAINAKCKSCIYDPQGKGTWRQQVTACRIVDCPLWELRPQSQGRTSGSKALVAEPMEPRINSS